MYKSAVKDLGLADRPEDLVEGLSYFLKEVGFNSSFIDKEANQALGLQEPLWQFL